MNKKEILNALYSGLEVVSTCKSQKLLLIDGEIYFGSIGSPYALKIDNEKELNLYKWQLTDFSEYLAK